MKVTSVFQTRRGTWVAALEDGRFVARLNSMELVFCRRNDKDFESYGNVFLPGFMMKTQGDFVEAVENNT